MAIRCSILEAILKLSPNNSNAIFEPMQLYSFNAECNPQSQLTKINTLKVKTHPL
jgi:hypothetical protein